MSVLTETMAAPVDELKLEDGEKGTISGYASVFGVMDGGGDVVTKGAFSETLGRRKVKMLWQHDPSQPIGRWTSMKEDDRGLYVRGEIFPGIQKGAEVLEMLRKGVLDGLSIGYRTVEAERGEAGGRTLTKVDLWEVSVVTFPMNQESVIDRVKADEWTKTGICRVLRNAGVPGAFAKKLVAAGFDAAARTEDEQRNAGGGGLGEMLAEMRAMEQLIRGEI